MDAFSYWITRGVYYFLFSFVLLPLLLVLYGLCFGLRALIGPGDLTLGLVIVGGFVWQVAAGWLAHKAAGLHVYQHQGFLAGASGAIDEGKLYLSFVPGLGRLVASRRTTSVQIKNEQ